MNKNYLDTLYDCNDELGVKMFGARGWNALKGRVCGVTDSMISKPRKISQVNQDRKLDELFAVLFRPNVSTGSELLGPGWVEYVEDRTLGGCLGDVSDSILSVVNSDKFKTGADIFHNAANIFQYVPKYGEIVPAARKGINTVTSIANSMGFGIQPETVETGVKIGGVVLLLGGAAAVWYFGFYKKKRRGRR